MHFIKTILILPAAAVYAQGIPGGDPNTIIPPRPTRTPRPTMILTRPPRPTNILTRPPPGVTIVPPPRPTHTYEDCGGFRPTPKPCPRGAICIDDPYSDGCGMACDMAGICVRPTESCGGLLGLRCKGGKVCVDDPRDDCDPGAGGSDCMGICV